MTAGATVRDVQAIWYTRCPVPTATGVAVASGQFTREFGQDGITVSSLRASCEGAIRESHFDHSHPDSFRQGGNIPPLWARSKGADVRLVGLSWAESFQAVISLPDSAIGSVEDLRGARIAVASRTNDQIDFVRASILHGLESALASAGLSLTDVEVIDYPVGETFLGDDAADSSGSLFGASSGKRLQAAEVHALIRGEADAIYATGARGVDIAAFLNARVVADLHTLGGPEIRINNITPVALTVNGAFLDERPDLVDRYLAALLRAARWAQSHPEETRTIVAREVGFAEEWMDDAYGRDMHLHLEPTINDGLMSSLGRQYEFLRKYGFVDGEIDLDRFVDPSPLERARAIVDTDSQGTSHGEE